jgi:beta-glucanase (GH16 family)
VRRLAAGLGVLIVLVSLGCSASATDNATDKPSASWTKVWSDDFNGQANSGVNTSYWKYDVGQGIFGTSEVETMTSDPSNVHLDGQGNLDVVAIDQGGSTAWTSGRLQTKRLFTAPAGGEMMVTAAIKQPDPAGAMGYWPGFWMLGAGTWPTDGEVDIMEDVNGLNSEAGTLHCGNLTQRNSDGTLGPCHEGNGVGSGLRPCAGCQQGFQTYTVIIDRRNANDQQIRWYLNGREFFSVSESKVGSAVWVPAVDNGFSILLDVAIGGSYPNAQCQCTTPTGQTSSQGTMVVRYVNVYTNLATGRFPSAFVSLDPDVVVLPGPERDPDIDLVG